MLSRLLAVILCAAACIQARQSPAPPNIEDKIRGGLLGQIIGDLNGLKHENKYTHEPGSVATYTPELPEGAWTDDDTDIEWIYLVEMEKTGQILIPYPRIAELWKKHINRRIWCSHKYLRQLLEIGIEPPLTGNSLLNPWAPFNLSGQFVSESWGLIAPGKPQTAARIALHYVHTSIDGEPAQSAQLFASMIAVAFNTSDLNAILDAGAASVDPKSQMRAMLDDVRRWHRENPSDWRATRKLIRDKYTLYPPTNGKIDIRDLNGVLLNGAGTIAALLYGKGDFVETIRHAFNFGWDADNNAATSATIVGVIKGHRWITSQGWKLGDAYKNTSRDELPDETIARYGDRLVKLSQIVARQNHRTPVEQPENIEPLVDSSAQLRGLQHKLRPLIEKDITGDNRARARAAYLAIGLDLAASFKSSNPEQWQQTTAALSSYEGVTDVLFRDSPGEPGRLLRERASAAGVSPPVVWTPLFDGKTLQGWKEAEFTGRGKVAVKDGAIALGAGYLTGVTWTGKFPTSGYELRFEAQRVSGGDFFAGITFPVQKSHCTWINGGWGGTLVGLSSLDGNDASENETSTSKDFVNGRWYKFRLVVTGTHIRGWIDDEQFIEVEYTGRRVELRPGEIDLNIPLGFASYSTVAALRKIEYRMF